MFFFLVFSLLVWFKNKLYKSKITWKKKKIKSYALLSKKIKNKIKAMLNIYIYIYIYVRTLSTTQAQNMWDADLASPRQ